MDLVPFALLPLDLIIFVCAIALSAFVLTAQIRG